jgi:hypothetical protein
MRASHYRQKNKMIARVGDQGNFAKLLCQSDMLLEPAAGVEPATF